MHIIIIEDEPDFRRELKAFLENSLYQVTLLTEFDRAASLALSLRPDLILLDLNLPGNTIFSQNGRNSGPCRSQISPGRAYAPVFPPGGYTVPEHDPAVQ